MESLYGEAAIYRKSATNEITIGENLDDEDEQGESPGGILDPQTRRYFLSPFKREPLHPLELSLILASYASDVNNYQQFRKYRQGVVEYLEPQYQRITSASINLTTFIKVHKKEFSFLSINSRKTPYNHLEREDYAVAILLLEDYAKSFERDMPDSTRLLFRIHEHNEHVGYSLSPRRSLLKYLSDLLQTDNCGDWGFREYFRFVVDDMYSQYLHIRSTRKALFDHDTEDPECDIALEKWRCDEMINWSVDEPDLQPQYLAPWQRPQAQQQDTTSDSRNDSDHTGTDASNSHADNSSASGEEEDNSSSGHDQEESDDGSASEIEEGVLNAEEGLEEWKGFEDTDSKSIDED